MEALETKRTCIQTGEWVMSIDYKDTYFHMPIQAESRKYLCFHTQCQSYQFKVLLFGLSTAPIKLTVRGKDIKLMALHRVKNPPVPRHKQGRRHEVRIHCMPFCGGYKNQGHQGQSYQFKALLFGLSTAPMELTVTVKEVKLMALHRI